MTSKGYVPLGAHLVGSLPLTSAADAFRTSASALGDRLRRVPDGETGPRADWIVWQYPVLSCRPEFEVGPPAPGFYRPLPRLKLRPGADASTLRFESLGYAAAARGSYGDFARLKRDRVIPRGCRFQVCLPTPLAPISAFVAVGDQAAAEVPYEARMMAELDEIVEAIPADQLAIQWDTNFELGMLDGTFPVWFPDASAGILERLLRISARVPPEVELGFHLCCGDIQQGFHREPESMGQLVELANALSAGLGRPLNWLHMPISGDRTDRDFYAALEDLNLRPETELYLGLIHPEDGVDGAHRRLAAAGEFLGEFGVATECGWGRRPQGLLPTLFELHRELSRPVSRPQSGNGKVFSWPAGFPRVPDEDWARQEVDPSGRQYDSVDNHGWYRNLDPTVEQLAAALEDGDILVDYSGGTGILLDRLRLRIFDREIGMAIVDSSPKFLRVALERFRDDHRVAFRLLRYLKEARRLQTLDEVLEGPLSGGSVDAIVSTNAIHLYTQLDQTLESWARVLEPAGRVFINSGNIRNPNAKAGEWILDETVYVVHEVATGLVRNEPRYAAYREVLDEPERLHRHLEFRDRVFVAPRPLEYYTSQLEKAGLAVQDASEATIVADVGDWFEFLKAYHEAVLGWVGGSARIEGKAPSEQAVEDRLRLMRHAMDVVFGGRKTFRCCWTYLTATRRRD
jgi:ubiquinone/menaquinone biosynthesis C-methylase UbiE